MAAARFMPYFISIDEALSCSFLQHFCYDHTHLYQVLRFALYFCCWVPFVLIDSGEGGWGVWTTLSRFDAGGQGACLKKFTDPSFFKAAWTESELKRLEEEEWELDALLQATEVCVPCSLVGTFERFECCVPFLQNFFFHVSQCYVHHHHPVALGSFLCVASDCHINGGSMLAG